MSKSQFIPYGRQTINDDDIQSVVDTLKSDWLTQGPAIPQFEAELAQYCGAEHATLFSNATAALHIACKVLDLQAGDVLWTTANTFVASANCALYCGAKVDFVDIDPKTYNMCVSALENKLQDAAKKNCLPKVVIPVHFAGVSCDMQQIKKLSEQYGFHIIEDASHAIGSRYQNKKIGACEYSDMAIFSFHPVKIITTGEGGAILTNNQVLNERIKLLRTHGITRDPKCLTKKTEGPWYYEQIALGYNYRMTDMQAALGNAQLKKLDSFLAQRHEKVKLYNQLLQHPDVSLPIQDNIEDSSWHLYVIQVPDDKRAQLFQYLRDQQIGVNVHYIPVYHQPYYQNLGFKQGYCPNTEKYYAQAITLPLYPELKDAELRYVVDTVLNGIKM